MNELTTERDILDIVGETDPSTIAQILALGATREELEEAACSEDAGVEVVGSETVQRLREILAELAAAEADEPYARTAEARP